MHLHNFLCYLAALSSAIIWIKTVAKTFDIFVLQWSKMSLADALCGVLDFTPTKMLAKYIQLEVITQDGCLEVREAKQPQKVSTSL